MEYQRAVLQDIIWLHELGVKVVVNGIRLADGTHLAELNATQANTLIDEGVIYGGMIPKIKACLEALADVPRVHIVNGSIPNVLLYEIEGHPNVGTTITR